MADPFHNFNVRRVKNGYVILVEREAKQDPDDYFTPPEEEEFIASTPAELISFISKELV